MPYKYVKNIEEKKEQPKVTETKELEKPKQPETEEEHQLATIKEEQDKFFDEDDEIIEVSFD